MEDLQSKRCLACEAGVRPFTAKDTQEYLARVKGWEADADNTTITRKFTFKGFAKTIAFVNAIAWIAHQENHHPDIEFGYNYCTVKYTTHAIKGLSENDFICAAKVDALEGV